MRNGTLPAILAMTFAAAVAAYLASPYVAVHRMQSAADARDAAALNDYVDFPALRTSLKAGVTAEVVRASGEMKDNPSAAAGAALAASMVDRAVDIMITPEGVAAMMQGRSPAPPATQDPGSSAREPSVRTAYETIDRFVVRIAHPDDPGKGVALVMRRERLLWWRLAEVRLPRLQS